jgi:hypothetical protein
MCYQDLLLRAEILMEGNAHQGKQKRVIHSKDQEIIRMVHLQQLNVSETAATPPSHSKYLPDHAEFSEAWELGIIAIVSLA